MGIKIREIEEIPGKVIKSFHKCGYLTIGGDISISSPENISIGDNVYIGDLSILEATEKITIGSDVLIGPRVTITTATHPLSPVLNGKKRNNYYYGKDIVIGSNVWIGAGSIILSGVVIGDGSVIGAGSVLTYNKIIPSNSLAYGNPCRIMRELRGREDVGIPFRIYT